MPEQNEEPRDLPPQDEINAALISAAAGHKAAIAKLADNQKAMFKRLKELDLKVEALMVEVGMPKPQEIDGLRGHPDPPRPLS